MPFPAASPWVSTRISSSFTRTTAPWATSVPVTRPLPPLPRRQLQQLHQRGVVVRLPCVPRCRVLPDSFQRADALRCRQLPDAARRHSAGGLQRLSDWKCLPYSVGFAHKLLGRNLQPVHSRHGPLRPRPACLALQGSFAAWLPRPLWRALPAATRAQQAGRRTRRQTVVHCTTCPSGNWCPRGAVNPINCIACFYEPDAGATDI